jgi:UDP-N-acetylmuramoyl-L-alanyl-D-glutamate--2,6-diaminopimelate ligase
MKNPAQANVIPDRTEAIITALDAANEGDVIAIAGKGHEDYQEILGVFHHFDDREVVEQWIKKSIS